MARPRKKLFAWDNNQALLSNGIALPMVGQDGSVAIMRFVTTYQRNRYGTPDQSYLDYETLAEIHAAAEGGDNAEIPAHQAGR